MIRYNSETNHYPVLINPTAEELFKIFEQKWDTLRVCFDKDNIGIASGYGNTHTSICKITGISVYSSSIIVYFEGENFLVNCDDIGYGPRVKFSKMYKILQKEHFAMLQEIVKVRKTQVREDGAYHRRYVE